jgi:hypothetical protein
MSEIMPGDDIMQVADNVHFDASISPTDEVAIEVIARAILAEREACAKIAEDNNHFPAEGEWIASLIRTPSTGEEQ